MHRPAPSGDGSGVGTCPTNWAPRDLGRGGPPLAGMPRDEAGSWPQLTGHEANQEAAFVITSPVRLESYLLLIIICVYRCRGLRKHQIIRTSPPYVRQLRAQTTPQI